MQGRIDEMPNTGRMESERSTISRCVLIFGTLHC